MGNNTDKLIQCQICGKWFSMINRNHLSKHGITTEEYVDKYGPGSLMTEEMRNQLAGNSKKPRKEDKRLIYTVEQAFEKFSKEQIIEMYKQLGSIRKLSEHTGIARSVLSEILDGLQNKDEYKFKYTSNKYHRDEDSPMIWVAVDKKDKIMRFFDVNNHSGTISKYLKERYNIETPSSWEQTLHFRRTGQYWYEEYFDFKLVDKRQKKLRTKRKFRNGLMKPSGYWNNKDRCFEEAAKYRSFGELQNFGGGCFDSIVRHGWKDEVYEKFYKQYVESDENKYMDYDRKIHCAYVYEIKELNACYVGRTSRLTRRHNQHKHGCQSHGRLTYDRLYKFCKKHEIEMPDPIVLEKDLNALESQEREEYWLNHYKEEGWYTINKGQVGVHKGSLGAKLKWTSTSVRRLPTTVPVELTFRGRTSLPTTWPGETDGWTGCFRI